MRNSDVEAIIELLVEEGIPEEKIDKAKVEERMATVEKEYFSNMRDDARDILIEKFVKQLDLDDQIDDRLRQMWCDHKPDEIQNIVDDMAKELKALPVPGNKEKHDRHS